MFGIFFCKTYKTTKRFLISFFPHWSNTFLFFFSKMFLVWSPIVSWHWFFDHHSAGRHRSQPVSQDLLKELARFTLASSPFESAASSSSFFLDRRRFIQAKKCVHTLTTCDSVSNVFFSTLGRGFWARFYFWCAPFRGIQIIVWTNTWPQ